MHIICLVLIPFETCTDTSFLYIFIQICSVHRILPDVYLHCKGVMIAESRKCGGKLRLMDARKLCRIDVNKTRKIYNHLVSKELVQPPS